MGKYEVTQGEYLAVMGTNPSLFQPPDFTEDLTLPVETVGWSDATNYCTRLSQNERAAGRIPTNSVYRLPTEAEWEYACRAWTSTRFSHGDDPGYTNLTNYAWFIGTLGWVRPVGQKLPNPWGLYDMHGNVIEWCQSWYSAQLPGGIVVDPQGPSNGPYHVLRGGSWGTGGASCRAAMRDYGIPDGVGPYFGFRVVLAPSKP
jgi:formylglycine-generating enzyme required for sulfatase activity